MNKKAALEFSLLIDSMCEEEGVNVEPSDRLWDITVKMVKKQDEQILSELHRRFCNRTSKIALNLIKAIETERNLRNSQ